MLAKTARSAIADPLPEPATLAEAAHLCKASGDPLRLQILRVLRQDSFGVLELCSIFECRQPAMSHHLKVLAAAGLVASRREGNTIFYRRTTAPAPQFAALQASIYSTIDQLELPATLSDGLARLHTERERSSLEFFSQNADKFRAQQDLIASYDQYADTVAEALRCAPLSRHSLALEIGPGDGAFLGILSPAFEQVVALDNAASMLDQARQLAATAELGNIRFIHGDTRHQALHGLQADCIVVNMVLHHTPSPAEIFLDLARCLAPKGVLLITDLCHHDQGWAREACGDLWLGFQPEDLQAWAAAAGLAEITSLYLAQRNGFQIQVRLFGHQAIQ
jgi:ubiquinone/menaquinone biosynthesis C-methylase UbiE